MILGHSLRCMAVLAATATIPVVAVHAVDPAQVSAASLLSHFPDRAHAVVCRGEVKAPERMRW